MVLGVEKKLPSKLMEAVKSEKLVEVKLVIEVNALIDYRSIDTAVAQWVES